MLTTTLPASKTEPVIAPRARAAESPAVPRHLAVSFSTAESDPRKLPAAVAALRAEWSKLDNPARIQELAARHLALKPIEARQFDRLDRLPERPPDPALPEAPIEMLLGQARETSSVAAVKGAR